MAHEVVYGFCENKCKVEVAPKTETDAFDSRITALEESIVISDDGVVQCEEVAVNDMYISGKVYVPTNGESGTLLQEIAYTFTSTGTSYKSFSYTIPECNSLFQSINGVTVNLRVRAHSGGHQAYNGTIYLNGTAVISSNSGYNGGTALGSLVVKAGDVISGSIKSDGNDYTAELTIAGKVYM